MDALFFQPSSLSAFPLIPIGSMAPFPPVSCGPTWVRTRDLPVMSRWLFQLSYGPFFYYIPFPRGVNPALNMKFGVLSSELLVSIYFLNLELLTPYSELFYHL